MRRFKIAFFETPFYLCVLDIYHVTRVATLSVRILVVPQFTIRDPGKLLLNFVVV